MSKGLGKTPKDQIPDQGSDEGIGEGQFFASLKYILPPIKRETLAETLADHVFQNVYSTGPLLGWQVLRYELFKDAVADYTCMIRNFTVEELLFPIDSGLNVCLRISRYAAWKDKVSDIRLSLFSFNSQIYRTHKDPQVINLATEIGVLDGLDISTLTNNVL